jgi:hypothetical protein
VTSIFLIHSSEDKIFARKLAKALRAQGIKVWLDEDFVRVGDSLPDTLAEAIDGSDFVGVILSRKSVESSWVKKELSLSIAKEVEEDKAVVFPLLLEECTIPVTLKDKLFADFSDDEFDEPLSKLLFALGVDEASEAEDQTEGDRPTLMNFLQFRNLLQFLLTEATTESGPYIPAVDLLKSIVEGQINRIRAGVTAAVEAGIPGSERLQRALNELENTMKLLNSMRSDALTEETAEHSIKLAVSQIERIVKILPASSSSENGE